jgi:hypothetical protein
MWSPSPVVELKVDEYWHRYMRLKSVLLTNGIRYTGAVEDLETVLEEEFPFSSTLIVVRQVSL